MAGNLTAMIASIFSGSAVTADPYFEYTTLLLPGNGTNGAQNNTFLDGSTNNFTITRNGNTTQGTFSPFSQTGWGNYFSGTGAYLTVNDNAGSDLDLGSGQFSVEFWWYPQSSSAGQYPLIGDSTGNWYIIWDNNAGSNAISLGRRAQGNDVNTTGFTLATNTWQQVVVTRQSTGTNDTRIFVNGVLRGIGTSSQNYTITTTLGIGGTSTGTNLINGYLSNVRIVKGSVPADYQTSSTSTGTTIFTPPTSPLTAVSGTTFLTCQSNRFVDNSATPKTITVNGTTSVQAFSPFSPTASWSSATYGGSGYFDGSGDYLSVPNSANLNSTGDFTIEGWAYITSASSYAGMFSMRASTGTTNGASITFINTGYIEFAVNPGGNNLTTPTPLNQWFHVALVRSGSSTNNCSCYLNGTRVAQFTSTSQANGASNGAVIGRYYADGTNQYWVTGYLSNVRYVVGTAVYSGATITVPTTPLTAISGTQFLCNFTNAGIYNAASKNDLETVGNAQISTTQSKFGGSSMYFDGTGDYLYGPSNNLVNFGTGAFTIEGWVYALATPSDAGFFTNGGAAAGSLGFYFLTGYLRFDIYSGGGFAATTLLPLNQWVHIACVRSGNTVTLYQNGTSVGSSTITDNNTSSLCYVGTKGWDLTKVFNGYMQDVRITKGYARYVTGTGTNAGKMVFNGTNDLALPTAAFPTL